VGFVDIDEGERSTGFKKCRNLIHQVHSVNNKNNAPTFLEMVKVLQF
jgi:hypothetical protein